MAMLQKGQLHVQSSFTADSRRTAVAANNRGVSTVRLPTRIVSAAPAPRAANLICQAAMVEAYKGDLLNKSYYPTSADASNSTKRWYIIDAEGQTLGRLACLAATYIRGKHLPTYTPSMDMGAFVVVINAEKVQVSGKKFEDKMYFNQYYNGRPGSAKMESFKDLQKRIPERIIERAVKGMLPKGSLGRNIRLHLKCYPGTAHTHEAQQPTDITTEISSKPKEGPGAKLREALLAKRV